MSPLPDKIHQALTALVPSIQAFVKTANALVACQIGSAIEKQAALTTDELVSFGSVKPAERDEMVERLTFNPKFALDGLRTFAGKLQKTASPLGTPIAQSSAAVGEKPSERVWNEHFGGSPKR